MVLRKTTIPPPHSHPQLSSPQILPVPNPTPSYWLTPPSHLSTLRTTPTLPTHCDIAIIGSGMAGVLTAYHILRSSSAASVVLLDARDVCSGATARNGGHVKVKTSTLAGLGSACERNEMAAYVRGVIGRLKKVVEEEDLVGICEFELRRSWDVFLALAEFEKVKGVYDQGVEEGEDWTRHVCCVEGDMAERVSSVQGAKGAFGVEAASLWPYRFVTGLLARMVERYLWCEDRGLNVQMHTPVTRITTTTTTSSSSSSGTNVLHTPRGEISAEKVVFATNAWTAGLLDNFKDTITPVKGMACHILPERPVYPHLNNTYNLHFPQGADYLNPRPDGGIVVGGGSWMFRDDRTSWHGNFDDSTRFPAQVEKYWKESYMQSNFLGWSDSAAAPDHIWVGIMGNTPDGKPHVGRVPEQEKQWMLAGFNGGGMALIATTAEAVAKMVIKDEGFEDVRAEFRLLRGFGTRLERMEM